MVVEIILFIFLILLLIRYRNGYFFRLGKTNGKNVHGKTKAKSQQIRSKKAETRTDMVSGRKGTVTDTSDDPDSRKENNKSAYTDTASDEFSETNRESDKIDPDDERNIFRSFVDEKSLNEHMEQNGILRGLMKFIRGNIEEWRNRKVNIAIIGNSGTGKSSLINALRGLKPSDDKAAPVGVTETTAEKKGYEFPKNQNVVLWDLPGVGTQQYRKEEYLDKMSILTFDAFIIVSASRFTENEIWLAKAILEQKKFMFFVRTKIDMDLMNEKRDHPDNFDTHKCLEAMRFEIRKNLDKASIPIHKSGIFLVSSVEEDSHDFQTMFDKLRNILTLKGIAVKSFLEKHVTELVRKETDAKKCQFIAHKAMLCVSSFIFLDVFGLGLFKRLTTRMYCTCKRAFCLDDETLDEFSAETNISVTDLKQRHLAFSSSLRYFENDYIPNYSGGMLRAMMIVKRDGFKTYIFPEYYAFIDKLHNVCESLACDEVLLIQLYLTWFEEQLTPLKMRIPSH